MMIPGRRDFIRVISAATLVGTGGCSRAPIPDGKPGEPSEPDEDPSDTSNGEGPLVFRATAVGVREQQLLETGYSLRRRRTFGIRRTIDVGDRAYEINARNRLAEYERTVSRRPFEGRSVARLVVVSSPRIEITDEEFDLITSISDERLAEELQSGYGDLALGEVVASETITQIGRRVEVRHRRGTALFHGHEIDVSVHTARTELDDDIVVTIGIYPQRISGLERPRTLALMEAVVYGES